MNQITKGGRRGEHPTFRERPILFSGPMVKAILDGRKTQTRRIVALTSPRDGASLVLAKLRGRYLTPLRDGQGLTWRPYGGAPEQKMPAEKVAEFCPYGVPGERLWVRETWQCLQAGTVETLPPTPRPRVCTLGYAATEAERVARYGHPFPGPWRPSIFMPRWASRLTLEITEVRVQRLQEISEEDAKAEGVERDRHGWRDYLRTSVNNLPQAAAADSFCSLWQSINGKRAPWSGNPWIWAITFRRAE